MYAYSGNNIILAALPAFYMKQLFLVLFFGFRSLFSFLESFNTQIYIYKSIKVIKIDGSPIFD